MVPRVVLFSAICAGMVALAACAQPAASTPTQAPTTAAKAAEPTKATAAAQPTIASAPQPTAAPAKKVDFPQKGKSITILVPFAAGGSTDIAARVLAPYMEKELGVPVEVVDKPGASTQTAATELVNSKPDGYTLLLVSIPTTLVTYLDPERKANYTAKSFQPVATTWIDGLGFVVKADSPFKTAKDVIDAAKAGPGAVKVSTAGLMGVTHLGALAWQKEAGVEFAYVHFNSGTEAVTAALGGHVDLAACTLGNIGSMYKAGTVRVVGIADSQPSPLVPGAPTLESQGYKVYSSAGYVLTAPAGTDPAVVKILETAAKNVVNNSEFKSKVTDIGMEARFMDSVQSTAYWAEREAWTAEMMKLAK